MSNKHKLTTISISYENYGILKQLGNTGDSFNDVLTRILNKTELLQSGSEFGDHGQIVTNAMNRTVKEEHNNG